MFLFFLKELDYSIEQASDIFELSKLFTWFIVPL